MQLDPRARRLALLVEGYAEEWSSWELANVSCAEVELELGSPALLDKVRSRPGPAGCFAGEGSVGELAMVSCVVVQHEVDRLHL